MHCQSAAGGNSLSVSLNASSSGGSHGPGRENHHCAPDLAARQPQPQAGTAAFPRAVDHLVQRRMADNRLSRTV